MRLLSLKLVQWRTFEHCELDFPDGLIGVVGRNGSGKTTLAEAIGWALFGKLRPGARVGDVRRQGANGARSCVELVFRLGDVVYRVERIVGGAAKLWIGDSGDPETIAVRATNARIVRELDMTWETFQRTVFARQKDVAALDPTGSADARRRHVERLLGLERYRCAAELARRRVKELDAELRGMRESAPDLDDLNHALARAAEEAAAADPAVAAAEVALETAKASVDVLERQLEDARRLAARHAELTGRRDRAVELIEELEDRLATHTTRRAERSAKVAQLGALDGRGDDVAELGAARRAWDNVHDREVARRAAEAKLLDISFDPEQAAERAARVVAVRTELEQLYRTPAPPSEALEQRFDALVLAEEAGPVGPALARLGDAEAQHDVMRTRVAVLEQEVERDRAHLQAIEESGPDAECSVCLRPYGADFGEILVAHRQRVESNSAALIACTEELQELADEYTRASASHRAAEHAAEAVARTTGPGELRAARAALGAARAAAEERAGRSADLERERLVLEPVVAADGMAEHATAEHRGRLAECTAQVERALARVGAECYEPEAHDLAITRHDDATTARELKLRLSSEIEASAGIDDELKACADRLSATVEERDDVDAQLEKLSFDAGLEEQLRNARGEATRAKEDAIESLGAARLAARLQDGRVRDLTERVEAAHQMHVRIAEQERALREHDVAAGILTDFRTAQNERAWPRLEEGAGALLSETTEGRYVDVRLSKEYKLVVVDRGEEHGLERYSGGEQDLASLCLRLAIADWVARERGVEMGFVVLDEVFGSQDDERQRRLVDELRILGNRFHQLLVITHVADIAELCEHQIVVSLDEPGRSRAEITVGSVDASEARRE